MNKLYFLCYVLLWWIKTIIIIIHIFWKCVITPNKFSVKKASINVVQEYKNEMYSNMITQIFKLINYFYYVLVIHLIFYRHIG